MQVGGVSLDLVLIMHEQAFGELYVRPLFSLSGKCRLENRLKKGEKSAFGPKELKRNLQSSYLKSFPRRQIHFSK